MSARSTWLGGAASLGIIASMALTGLGSTARAGGVHHSTVMAHAPKTGTIPARCKRRTASSGTITYSDWQFPDTLNGYQSTEAVTFETTNSLFDGLTRYTSSGHLVSDMLVELPSVKNKGITNGGKTITLHLKKGMLWSTGQEIISKDLKFGFAVDSDPLTGPACKGSCDYIARIDTPNKYTAVLHMKSVYAPAIPNALPDLWPSTVAGAWNNNAHAAAAKLAQDQSYNFENSSYPTNGPYQVGKFIKGNRIVLHPNPRYNIENCGAAVRNLIFTFYHSRQGMIAAAAQRQTDVTQDYTLFDLPELQKHLNSYKLHLDPGFTIEHLELNHDATYNGAPNPLSDVNVRLALALALDKVGMIESALSVSKKSAKQIEASSFLVNTPRLVQPFADRKLSGQWDPLQHQYVEPGTAKAVKDAKILLARTPYASGFKLNFESISGNPIRAAQAARIQSSWSKIGVTFTPDFQAASKLFGDWNHGGTLDHGAFQVGMVALPGGPEPDGFKLDMQSQYIDRNVQAHSSTNTNYSAIVDPQVQQGFTKGAATLDSSLRQRYYTQVQVAVNQKAHWIPLYFRPSISTDDGHVRNFSGNPILAGPEWNTYNWQFKAR